MNELTGDAKVGETRWRRGLGRGLASLIGDVGAEGTEAERQRAVEESARHAEEERKKAEAERQGAAEDARRAEEERKQAKAERHRAAEDAQRAEEERKQAEVERQRAAEDARRAEEERKQATIERNRGPRRLPIGLLHPSPYNPRKDYPPEKLEELAESIKSRGMIQPIAVRPVRGGASVAASHPTPDPTAQGGGEKTAGETYEIIAGERRWQAAQLAGLHEVPVVVMLDVDDIKARELAIIENVQREDLNPLEEAEGYQALTEHWKKTRGVTSHPEEIAKAIGKSRSHVINLLRLLKLPEPVQVAIRSGKLSFGHARALIDHPEAEQLARNIIDRGLSVRQVEELVRPATPSIKTKPGVAPPKPADTLALEKQVSDALGLAVTIDHRRNGGAVHIRYRSLDQLREVMRRLERSL